MGIGNEYKREVLSDWFDLRRVLSDRRRLLSDPELALGGRREELSNSALQFAVKCIVLPAAAISLLAGVPSTLLDLPSTAEEREIARLEALADSTERSAERRFAGLDSATLQRAKGTEWDSVRAHHEARIDSLEAAAPDTVGLRDSTDAILTRVDSLDSYYQGKINPLIDRFDSLVSRPTSSLAVRDSVLSLEAKIQRLLAEYQSKKAVEKARFDSINAIYIQLIAMLDSQARELERLNQYGRYEIADTERETAGYQRQVAANKLADLKLKRFLKNFQLPISAGLVILNAYLFGWILTRRYDVSTRKAAHLHMYVATAVLLIPGITMVVFGKVVDFVNRFPDSPVQVGLFPVWALLMSWILYAVYVAANTIASVVNRPDGKESRFETAWIAVTLLVTDFAALILVSVLINFATYPLSRLIVSLSG